MQPILASGGKPRIRYNSISIGTLQRDFRLPSRCKRDLRSSEMLRSVGYCLVTDVWKQPIGLIFKGKAIH